MPRSKAGTVARAAHKKVIKKAKGYFSRRKNIFRVAVQLTALGGKPMRLIANSLVTTSLVMVAAFAATPVRAADVPASSAVDAVTVYPDGASVTRVITVDLPAGDHSAVLKDFPLTLDPSSLRVEGEAAAKLTIGAIDAKPRADTGSRLVPASACSAAVAPSGVRT